MATITAKRKRAVFAGAYSNWGTITGNTIVGDNYNCHCIYEMDVSMTGAERITKITFKNTFASDISGSITYHCYMYTSDPTADTPSTPPTTGLLHHFEVQKTITTSGLGNSVVLNGLNLANITKLYFWVTATYNATSGGIYCCDQSSAVYPTSATLETTQRYVTLTVAPSSVTTSAAGSKVGLFIENGTGFTLYADFYYGSAQQPFASERVYNGSNQVTCPRSWFDDAGVTTLLSMTVTVKIRGGSNTPTGSFTLNAGRDMQPTVSNVTAAIVQPASAAAYPETYIASISKVKITAAVTLNTNAGIATRGVYFYYPGGPNVVMTLNQSTGLYEGTTAAPITQDTEFTVRAVDVRNTYGEGSVSVVDVVPYTLPSAVINSAYRCNSQGEETSGGDYWKIRATATCSTALDGNSVTLKAGVKNGDMNTLTNETMCGPFPGTTNPMQAYTIVVTVQDLVSGVIQREFILEGMKRDFVLNHVGDHTHLGVGTTPVGKDVTGYKDTIELPHDGLFLMGKVPAQAFNLLYWAEKSATNTPFGKNLLNVSASRTGEANATAVFSFLPSEYEQWSNVPYDPLDDQTPPSGIRTKGWMGWREVYYVNQNVQFVKITEMAPKAGRIWLCFRGMSENGQYKWFDWKYFMPTTVPSV